MKVPCSYSKCKDYRSHHESDEPRGIILLEVPDDHTGPMYCSLTCAALDGRISIYTKRCHTCRQTLEKSRGQWIHVLTQRHECESVEQVSRCIR